MDHEVKSYFMNKILSAALAVCALGLTSIAQTPPGNSRSVTSNSASGPQGIPTAAIPEYVIGPADVVEIRVQNEASFSGTALVRPDGKVTIYSIDDIQAAGLTTMRLAEQISKSLSIYFKTDPPPVTVTLLEMKSKTVYIQGKGIAKPGSTPLSGPLTVMELISIAGGLKEYAKVKDIKIFRMENGETKILLFNYETFQNGTDLKQNIELRARDIVDVP